MDTIKQSLHNAVCEGDRNMLRSLIHTGHRLDITDDSGWNPLHAAAAAGNMGCVRELLSSAASGFYSSLGAYVDKQDNDGDTALCLAVSSGHHDIVRLLLNAGADINHQNTKGSIPLFSALTNEDEEMVKLLIQKGADVHTKKFKHCDWSCLHFATAQGSRGIVCALLPLCNLELCDNKERTALFLAAKKGHKQCLEILADAGACVNAQAIDFTTPLMAATVREFEDCVEVLLDHGADPNLLCSRVWPQLPIHVATTHGSSNILKRLIAVTDRAIDRGEGMVSPVYEALLNPPMLELLLNEGYSPEGQDGRDVYDVDSPLSLALSYDFMDDDLDTMSEAVQLLIAAGASVTEDSWKLSLSQPQLLLPLLKHRQKTRAEPQRTDLFDPGELRALQSVTPILVTCADKWLPTLLQTGLDPRVLLLPDVLMRAESRVLNYLLEFVNWSTLSLPLKGLLEQRLNWKTWMPHTHLVGIPSLFHLCRLQVREVLGPGVVMRTSVVEQLPVPTLLHTYLRFSDILPP